MLDHFYLNDCQEITLAKIERASRVPFVPLKRGRRFRPVKMKWGLGEPLCLIAPPIFIRDEGPDWFIASSGRVMGTWDEQLHGCGGPLLTRDRAFAGVAKRNRRTLDRRNGRDLRGRYWWGVTELGRRPHAGEFVEPFLGADGLGYETWSVPDYPTRLVQPTPEELAQYAI